MRPSPVPVTLAPYPQSGHAGERFWDRRRVPLTGSNGRWRSSCRPEPAVAIVGIAGSRCGQSVAPVTQPATSRLGCESNAASATMQHVCCITPLPNEGQKPSL